MKTEASIKLAHIGTMVNLKHMSLADFDSVIRAVVREDPRKIKVLHRITRSRTIKPIS